ncbi:MAG: hypothetical protein IPP44_27565 [Ideonella sp.]|nr:hypothetical protein [Ideonella sp.]
MSGSNSSNPDVNPDVHDAHDPVGMTVHSMPSAEAALARPNTVSGRVKMILVLLVCAAPVVASYFSYYVIRPDSGSTAYGRLIQPTVATPDVAAKTLDDQAVALRSIKGQWLLLLVGGGACDEACEKRLFMQRQLREMTGRERDRIDKVWLVTDAAPVKPELRKALEATPGMKILRLPREAVAGWLKPEAGHALEEHLYIVDPMGEWMMRMPVNADPVRVKRDVERLLRASASWHHPPQ